MSIRDIFFHIRHRKSNLLLSGLMTMFIIPTALPSAAQAGNVGWSVSVGGGNGYGGWRPAAYPGFYGSGWRGAYGPSWRNGYYGPAYAYPNAYPFATGFYSPPVVYVAPPQQPLVLAAQPQPPVWYFCEASGQYFPYVQNCPSAWQIQPATPPTSNAAPQQRSYN